MRVRELEQLLARTLDRLETIVSDLATATASLKASADVLTTTVAAAPSAAAADTAAAAAAIADIEDVRSQIDAAVTALGGTPPAPPAAAAAADPAAGSAADSTTPAALPGFGEPGFVAPGIQTVPGSPPAAA